MRVPLLLSGIMATGSTLAQSPYRPFPEGLATWHETHSWLQPYGSNFAWHTCHRSISFAGDTIVDGLSYHRLVQSGSCSFQEITMWPPGDYGSYSEPASLVALIRQDPAARKVFIYDPQFSVDTLLYDFNLSPGFYPSTFNNPSPGGLLVVGQDSLELGDGWHRRWALGYSMNDSAFCHVIEGVGSTYGLLAWLIPPFENAEQLDCFGVSGTTIYTASGATCAVVDMVKEGHVTDMTVFPNPTAGGVRFTGIPGRSSLVLVRDGQGRIVSRTRSVDGMLDISLLSPGIYQLLVSGQDGLIHSALVVKQ